MPGLLYALTIVCNAIVKKGADTDMTMRCICAAVLFVVTGMPVVAQENGAEIYKSKCQRCHGADGQSHTLEGRMSGAAVLTDLKVTGLGDADLIAVVKDGKKKMPAFGKKLSDDQITAVVAYVRALPAPTR